MHLHKPMIAILAMVLFAGVRPALAHHGGSHCKYTYDDKFGTLFEITFKDGRKLTGLLFVMGNTADEMMVEIGDSGTYSNVYLHTITRIERRRNAGERHILDFTTTGGVTFPVYGHAGNVLVFKTSFGIMDILLPDVEAMRAPQPPPVPAGKPADFPIEKSPAPARQSPKRD